MSAAVDLTGDGRNLVKVAAGWFSPPYSVFGLQWFNDDMAFGFWQYAWVGPSDPSESQLVAPSNWEFLSEQSASANPSTVDPALKPNRVAKALVAFERQVRTGWALRVRGVFSTSDHLIEDVGTYAPELPSESGYLLTNFECKRRDYRALELELNGRIGTSVTFDASYTWSRGRGTNSGNSFEPSIKNSTWGGGYDVSSFGDRVDMPPGSANEQLYDQDRAGVGGPAFGDEGWYGNLPYSVAHNVKLLASWFAPCDIRVSVSAEYLSGYPWEKKGWVGAGFYGGFPEGRGGRTTPAHAYADVAVEKVLKLPKGVALSVGLNVYNLFNSQLPVSYIQEDTDLFGQVWGRQLPRWTQITAAVRF